VQLCNSDFPKEKRKLMAKIVVIGAGSLVFATRLTVDILSVPELAGSTLAYVDIDPNALAMIKAFAEQLIAQHKLPAQVQVTTDRRVALAGADYVITTYRVGGAAATALDLEIPLKYGIDQAVGDTIGPGGVFYGQAHIPLMIDICRDMEELCPNAWLLNHTNPMAMLCWAVNQATSIKNVGLCHSVQQTSEQLAGHIGVPYSEVDYWVAGINHMAWFLKFTWQGNDAYPLLRQRLADWDAADGDAGLSVTNHPENPYYGNDPWSWDTVRRDLFRQFGYYVTESTAHLSEYLPYFRRDTALLERYALKPQNLAAFAKRWESRRQQQHERLQQQATGETSIPLDRTSEYSSSIIESIETGRICRVNVNVRNTGLITNLPPDCVVEVPCLVDRLGVHPCYVGNLPPQLAALNRTNINVQELSVKAALEGNRDALYQAVALDPLTAAKLSLREIRQMVDEMVTALQPWLPAYR
jgi:alpha-galactosidase